MVSPQRNGHQFIQEVYGQGVRGFVVSEKIDASLFPDAAFIQVDSSLKALQQLAAYHRSQFDIPLIAITGSNGKTIVKEWLNQLLAPDFNIVRSPKSYNSQIGVPLSVWQMDASNTLGIFEAGISQPGEMAALEKIIQPSIGILTNVGAAHDEGFEDRKQKLEEKLQLFTNTKTLVYCKDDALLESVIEKLPTKKYCWGKKNNADVNILNIVKKEKSTTISAFIYPQYIDDVEYYPESPFDFDIPFTDDASIENVMHCICACKVLGLDTSDIIDRIQQLHPIQMRLESKKAINNSLLINDSYSNDLSSLTIALDYLKQQQQTEKETVILSDILQSGLDDKMLYFHVAELLAQRKIQRVIGIGNAISRNSQVFIHQGIVTETFATTDDFIKHLDSFRFRDETILLKGARAFGFEKIAALLEQQDHQTVLEINLTALSNNLKVYRSLLQPTTKLMVMVKAFGYGSGASEIAKALQFNKVDYLGVAYADEGSSLRASNIQLPIMVMNPEPSTFDSLEESNLEPEIYSFDILNQFLLFCQSKGIASFPVHIKLDTGMHRLGFEPHEVPRLVEILSNQNFLKIKSVFTHLVASEDAAQDAFTQNQAARFIEACILLESGLGYPFVRHAANTAAITRHPKLQMDMVRLGIGLYGVDSAHEQDLAVVTTLRSTIAQIKKIKAGDSVGYNRRGAVHKDSLIATVRIGYADGYSRRLGNGVGSMHLQGQLAHVIGNVCMDMTMIDITHIPDARPGDQVEIFGNNIAIQTLAQQCGTIPYEIMTSISQRVKRVYYEE